MARLFARLELIEESSKINISNVRILIRICVLKLISGARGVAQGQDNRQGPHTTTWPPQARKRGHAPAWPLGGALPTRTPVGALVKAPS